MGIVYIIASKLPKGIVFGRSYLEAKRIQNNFIGSDNKSSYVKQFINKKLQDTYGFSKKCAFYKDYDFGKKHIDLEFIDKDQVLSESESMIRTRVGADLVTTGGTSGKPLAFFIDKRRKGFEWYWMTSGWRNAGFDPDKSWRAVLRNHNLSGKKFIVNHLLREVIFNNFNLTDEYLESITQIISNKNIEFVHAYPSAAYALASFWYKKNKKPNCVKSFLCGSENVLYEQKRLIQSVLKIKMHTWYGHSEKLILAHEGEQCENYHSNPFYGYAEIINSDGLPVVEPGETGELVGTGFINTKMPFIRYKTGDYAEFVGHVCPSCGHIGLTFKNIKGRWAGDKIYLSNDTYVTTTSLNLHDEFYSFIDGLQYVQNDIGKLEVCIIPGEGWSDAKKEKLLRSLYEKVPSGLKFYVNEVSFLELSKNRKFQVLIQRIKSI